MKTSCLWTTCNICICLQTCMQNLTTCTAFSHVTTHTPSHTHTCTYTLTEVSTHTQMHTTTQIMYANRYVHTYRHHTHTCHTHIKQSWHDLPRVPPTNSLPPSETPSINSSGPNTAPCKEHCVTEMQKVSFPPQLDGRIFPWFPLLLL